MDFYMVGWLVKYKPQTKYSLCLESIPHLLFLSPSAFSGPLCLPPTLLTSLWKSWFWFSSNLLLPFWNSGLELPNLLIFLLREARNQDLICENYKFKCFKEYNWTKQILTWATSDLTFVTVALNPSLVSNGMLRSFNYFTCLSIPLLKFS